MGQVLYRKYRSKRLSEVVGQEHITTTLAHALTQHNISHAYLFTGPRGVGKTSVARILAHEINGLSYTDESMHLDIIEIDAASNRRIDEIRDLRDKVHITPTSAKYKVYIIDEVHMLTREAFNALLKTLEEPPEHVVFILATTEAHKLPETIISRTQRFTFKPVAVEKVVAHLRAIANKEKIKIDDNALQLIAEYGEGSFRDSISLLDQVRNQKTAVTSKDVRSTLGLAPVTAIEKLQVSLEQRDAPLIVETLNRLQQQGFEAAMIAVQLGSRLRAQLLQGKVLVATSEILLLLKELLEVPISANPRIALELALLGAVYGGNNNENHQSLQSSAAPAIQPGDANRIHTPSKSADLLKPSEDIKASAHQVISKLDDNLWDQVLMTVKRQHNTLYSVLRMAVPHFTGTHLELTLAFAFHQKRLNEQKNKQIIAETVQQLSGQKVTITCVLKDTAETTDNDQRIVVKSKTNAETASDTALNIISNIFGDAELLES